MVCARRLLGENNEHLGRIVGVLGGILARGSGKDALVEAETWQKIVTLMQQMHASLPAPVRCCVHDVCDPMGRCWPGWVA